MNVFCIMNVLQKKYIIDFGFSNCALEFIFRKTVYLLTCQSVSIVLTAFCSTSPTDNSY